jgi:hypothetical protein
LHAIGNAVGKCDARPLQPFTNGRFIGPDSFRDFGSAKALQIEQVHGLTEPFWKLSEAFVHDRKNRLISLGFALIPDLMLRLNGFQNVVRDHEMFIRPRVFVAFIADDSSNPRAEVFASVKVVEAFPRNQKRFLHNVTCGVFVSRNGDCVPNDPPMMSPDKNFKRLVRSIWHDIYPSVQHRAPPKVVEAYRGENTVSSRTENCGKKC